MKTKYGEVKSIYDLFETGESVRRKCEFPGWDEQGEDWYICKLCQEKISEYYGPLMNMSGGPLETARQHHIKLHETINKLGI